MSGCISGHDVGVDRGSPTLRGFSCNVFECLQQLSSSVRELGSSQGFPVIEINGANFSVDYRPGDGQGFRLAYVNNESGDKDAQREIDGAPLHNNESHIVLTFTGRDGTDGHEHYTFSFETHLLSPIHTLSGAEMNVRYPNGWNADEEFAVDACRSLLNYMHSVQDDLQKRLQAVEMVEVTLPPLEVDTVPLGEDLLAGTAKRVRSSQ